MNVRNLTSFLAGIIFALGLGISQMTDPKKVLNFLDFFGDWDPSLALVMGAALGLNVLLFRGILRRDKPAFDVAFHLPTTSTVNSRLVLGSALFGLGWGLSGYCPGAAIAAAPTGSSGVLLFLGAMTAGMAMFHAFNRFGSTPAAAE